MLKTYFGQNNTNVAGMLRERQQSLITYLVNETTFEKKKTSTTKF